MPPGRTSRSHDNNGNHHFPSTPSTSNKIQVKKTDKLPTDKSLAPTLDINNYTKWTVQDVAAYLKSKWLKEEAQIFSSKYTSAPQSKNTVSTKNIIDTFSVKFLVNLLPY